MKRQTTGKRYHEMPKLTRESVREGTVKAAKDTHRGLIVQYRAMLRGKGGKCGIGSIVYSLTYGQN